VAAATGAARPKKASRGDAPARSDFGARFSAAQAVRARAVGYAEVALYRPLPQTYTYAIPPSLSGQVEVGKRVAVSFGPRREVGMVVRAPAEPPAGNVLVKELAAVLDREPALDEGLLSLCAWIAEEYACTLGEALAALLPAPMKREGGQRRVLKIQAALGVTPEALAALESRQPAQHRLLRTLLEIDGEAELRDLLRRLGLSDAPAKGLAKRGLALLRQADSDPLLAAGGDRERPRPSQLSPGQSWALESISMALELRQARPFLLQGITGSGKTEVYLRAIERCLALGRSAITLVPEIALTPQTVSWFRARFGEVALLHSRLTDAQRLSVWKRVRSGELRVVVGARSALFAPVVDLGLIVIDEEHEPSFKQASNPRYHAREVALERARRAGAVVILGSATPSLETFSGAAEGRFHRLLLPERVGGGKLPPVTVVDMRQEPQERFTPVFSRLLRQSLEETLNLGQQALLFLNRRGYSPVLYCASCRHVTRCHQCATALSWHKQIGRLVCHLCGQEQPVPKACPICTAPRPRWLGSGSERVESVVAALFPAARVARMDSDTMRRREDYERVLQAFGAGEIDVLVGTQMIAKGLDFPRVTLVGIVSADTSLHLPDFRAAERTFQLLSQVAGRAGRSHLPGRILIQTENPEHPAIRLAAKHDFEAFAAQELADRRALGYPPATRLIRVLFESEDPRLAASSADQIAETLKARFASPLPFAADPLAPAPASAQASPNASAQAPASNAASAPASSRSSAPASSRSAAPDASRSPAAAPRPAAGPRAPDSATVDRGQSAPPTAERAPRPADARPLPISVLGAAPAPLTQLRGRHRHHLLLKAPPGPAFTTARAALLELLTPLGAQHNQLRITLDIDPVNLL
jgi:primosomal protein N' (replication factor Y)